MVKTFSFASWFECLNKISYCMIEHTYYSNLYAVFNNQIPEDSALFAIVHMKILLNCKSIWLRFCSNFSSIKSYLQLKNGQTPALKAGSSGIYYYFVKIRNTKKL